MHGVLQHVKVGVCTQGSQPLVLQGSSVAALAAFCLPSQRHWVCLQMGPVGFLLPYKTGGKKKNKKKKGSDTVAISPVCDKDLLQGESK